MRYKIFRFSALLLTGLLLFSGCSSSGTSQDNPNTANSQTEAAPATSPAPSQAVEKTLTLEEFDALLAEQPLAVTQTRYVVQDEQYKSLYPDMLQATLTNHTDTDIKNAVVAFVAWDENNLPVKIEGQFDFSDGDYIKQVRYDGINLIAGGTAGEDGGYSLGEDNSINHFKAIAVSFETFEGDTWKNPYFDDFCDLYKDAKYAEDMTLDVKISDSSFVPAPRENTSTVTASDLEARLSEQPVTIIHTSYVVQDETYKTLYPDMLQVTLQNNTEDDIRNVVVAFVAWDENNLPVKIEGQFDFGDSSYIKKATYNDVNLAAGATAGENSGFSLSEHCGIKTFKAIVVSYETFDGDTWTNPCYDDFCTLYEEKKLSE